ncbi:MAG: outer membrane beta-barrel protein [Bacteroidia bacterium]
MNTFSQTKDSGLVQSAVASIKVSGYIDAYYAFYTDSLGMGAYQKFPSISPRSNQLGLNTAMITASYDGEKARAIVTLHFGDIPRSTWSSTMNNVMEAHAGILLHKNLWLDAGLFRTHFGTEGLLPKENFTSSVSVNTFFEPYYEAGARLNFNPNPKLSMNLYVLNGYNLYEDNNGKKSIGLLVTYALSDKGNIGYSNYTGDDSPVGDTVSHLRIHNNVFWNYQVKKIKFQLGGDYCMQKNSDTTGKVNAMMYSGVAGVKFQAKKKFAVYGRYEFFQDPQGCMSGVMIDKEGKKTGIKMWGATLGLEYKPDDNSYIRLEGRQIQMDKNQEIFHWDGKSTSSRAEVMVNMGVSF